jgi:hypothetical protein
MRDASSALQPIMAISQADRQAATAPHASRSCVLFGLLLVLSAGATPAAAADPAGQAQASGTATGTEAFSAMLIALEKQSWEAWKQRDAKFFERFLADDHVEVGFGGVIGKAGVVSAVASPACVVEGYAVDHFSVTRFSATSALVNYHAAQKTTCAGAAVPSPVWASSLYIMRGDRWLNVLYQQSQIPHD